MHLKVCCRALNYRQSTNKTTDKHAKTQQARKQIKRAPLAGCWSAGQLWLAAVHRFLLCSSSRDKVKRPPLTGCWYAGQRWLAAVHRFPSPPASAHSAAKDEEQQVTVHRSTIVNRLRPAFRQQLCRVHQAGLQRTALARVHLSR